MMLLPYLLESLADSKAEANTEDQQPNEQKLIFHTSVFSSF
jgi:hypothetical protein